MHPKPANTVHQSSHCNKKADMYVARCRRCTGADKWCCPEEENVSAWARTLWHEGASPRRPGWGFFKAACPRIRAFEIAHGSGREIAAIRVKLGNSASCQRSARQAASVAASAAAGLQKSCWKREKRKRPAVTKIGRRDKSVRHSCKQAHEQDIKSSLQCTG